MILSNCLGPVNIESFGLRAIFLIGHQWRNLTQRRAHGRVLSVYALRLTFSSQRVTVPLIPSSPRTLTPALSPTRKPATVDNTAIATTAHSVGFFGLGNHCLQGRNQSPQYSSAITCVVCPFNILLEDPWDVVLCDPH